ncbi:zinc transporter ZIP11-like isoform X1 [Neocloeon triangulifer]|uniref:zinc transporter ZIP11-like isoform X1 n=1 Tax=Neocloeon triangulifer TaxID=2078957 RepID=UPI00286F7307|nr:zinc transporter ZIP11-like isoform X1 [Neocloeon triangulifer]
MIEGYEPLTQAILGTLFTWGMTAAGAALVIFFHGSQRKLLDGSLGFAAGVMTAASYWSLLAPAIEMAKDSGLYGSEGQWAFVPVAIGFMLGSLFVFGTDVFLATFGIPGLEPAVLLAEAVNEVSGDAQTTKRKKQALKKDSSSKARGICDETSGPVTRRRVATRESLPSPSEASGISVITQVDLDSGQVNQAALTASGNKRWKRIMLLIIAITVHNIPEGLAVGVSFGAIGESPSATFEKARNLAIGIGLQNFPEGLAVSLPLHGAGFSIARSFWYGQLSGMVEPIAGILGAAAVQVASPLLPYALSFAAGAMIYVVLDDIVPEANSGNNGRLATWGGIVGFTLMMALDVGLG